jgi:hypothetical protein
MNRSGKWNGKIIKSMPEDATIHRKMLEMQILGSQSILILIHSEDEDTCVGFNKPSSCLWCVLNLES